MKLRSLCLCALTVCLLGAGLAQAATYAMHEDFESYDPAKTLAEQGWFGSQAVSWTVGAPSATGNPSAQAAELVPGSPNSRRAYKYMGTSPFSNNEKVMYFGDVYGSSGVGFAPVHTDGVSTAWYWESVSLGIQWGTLRLRQRIGSGTNFAATNLTIQDHWYRFAILVDPTDNGGSGSAQLFYRDLTEGGLGYRQIWFDNGSTTIPLTMSHSGSLHRSTVEDLNSWSISASYANAGQVDNLLATNNTWLPMVPEPATMTALLAASAGLAGYLRRRRR